MKKRYFLFLTIALLFSACDQSDDSLISNFLGCSSTMGCTEIFISLSYTPIDDNNQPIVLDNFYTQNLDNGNTYSIQDHNLDLQNSYIVIDDDQLAEINKTGTNIRFFGIVDDQIVLQQDFVVGHDCCHVIPVSGPFDD
ncbi:hypothetical protein [Roseivirga sp.]|uniref:hypothetical protein n=1 Tax=Roseivirga sp. TaxID=1964215 RepID=UPI003B8AD955